MGIRRIVRRSSRPPVLPWWEGTAWVQLLPMDIAWPALPCEAQQKIGCSLWLYYYRIVHCYQKQSPRPVRLDGRVPCGSSSQSRYGSIMMFHLCSPCRVHHAVRIAYRRANLRRTDWNVSVYVTGELSRTTCTFTFRVRHGRQPLLGRVAMTSGKYVFCTG